MKVKAKPVPRWPRISPGILGFVALWGLVVIAARVYTHYTGADLDSCLFHRITGYSCPTCGTTRGLMAMARGAWRESFAWNPLTMTGAVACFLATAGRVLTARTLEFEFSPMEKRVLLGFCLAVTGINWAWLIHSHP